MNKVFLPKHSYMESIDPDENFLCGIRKHIFGIIIVYIQVIVAILAAFTLSYFLLPSVLGEDTGFMLANIIAAFLIVIATLMMLIATILYRQNKLVVTDRNITQVLQNGLFNRKVSQLNMSNVEDVTSDQRGVFATLLNFGTLKIETAGEQVNFHFTFCPNPRYYAKIILDAREKFTHPDSTPIPKTSTTLPPRDM